MKRIVRLVVIVIAVVALVVAAVEITARVTDRGTLLPAEAAGRANQRGWCDGAWLATDGAGQRGESGDRAGTGDRNESGAALVRPLTDPIVVVGGEFTAGAGLDLEELFPQRLAARAQTGGFSEVVTVVAADKLATARRILASPRSVPRSGTGPTKSVIRHSAGPDLLVLELDGRDAGGDLAPWVIAAQSTEAAPSQRSPTAPLPPLPITSSSAAWNWMRVLGWRRNRDAFERSVEELVARDTYTGRATARAKLRLDQLTHAVQQRQLDPQTRAFLRVVLTELHGLVRTTERGARIAEWATFFKELQVDQRLVVVVMSGPTLLTLGMGQAALDASHVVVHAPPFELDPELRAPLANERPAAVVHAQVARSIAWRLTKRGLLVGDAALPAADLETADSIEEQFQSRGGFDEALFKLVEAPLSEELVIGLGEPPIAALSGIGRDGQVAASTRAEVVLRRAGSSTDLFVRADVPTGALPTLRLRYAVFDKVQSVESSPELLGPVDGHPDRQSVEWRFAPPPAHGPIDFPALEFALLPPAGKAPEAWHLRSVRFAFPIEESGPGR